MLLSLTLVKEHIPSPEMVAQRHNNITALPGQAQSLVKP